MRLIYQSRKCSRNVTIAIGSELLRPLLSSFSFLLETRKYEQRFLRDYARRHSSKDEWIADFKRLSCISKQAIETIIVTKILFLVFVINFNCIANMKSLFDANEAKIPKDDFNEINRNKVNSSSS